MRLKIQVPISKIIAMHVSNMSNETFMLMNLGIIVEKIVVNYHCKTTRVWHSEPISYSFDATKHYYYCRGT